METTRSVFTIVTRRLPLGISGIPFGSSELLGSLRLSAVERSHVEVTTVGDCGPLRADGDRLNTDFQLGPAD
jgi:hypothetical protein